MTARPYLCHMGRDLLIVCYLITLRSDEEQGVYLEIDDTLGNLPSKREAGSNKGAVYHTQTSAGYTVHAYAAINITCTCQHVSVCPAWVLSVQECPHLRNSAPCLHTLDSGVDTYCDLNKIGNVPHTYQISKDRGVSRKLAEFVQTRSLAAALCFQISSLIF